MENKNNLQVVYVPVSELKVADYNPRKWSKDQLDQLKESIKKYVFVDPLVCNNDPNRKNVLIGGHMRVKAAKELGVKLIPVVYITISDLEREKETAEDKGAQTLGNTCSRGRHVGRHLVRGSL